MSSDIRNTIRSVLREHLNGPKNAAKRDLITKSLSIGSSTIRNWINPGGTNIPSTEQIIIICDILEITPNQLFGINQSDNDKMITDAIKLYNSYNDSKHKLAIEVLLKSRDAE